MPSLWLAIGRGQEPGNDARRRVRPVIVNYASINKTIIDFSGVEQIFLEQNYRSTGGILAASLAIVSQGAVSVQVFISN